MLMQILAGAAGSSGFARLYNVRGRALAFALLVQLFTNPVLDRVDPVSSLKSVE